MTQELLGHSKPETTRLYVQLPGDALRAAMQQPPKVSTSYVPPSLIRRPHMSQSQLNPQDSYVPAASHRGRVDSGFKRFLTLRLVGFLWIVALIFIGLSVVTSLIIGAYLLGTDDQGAVVGWLVILGGLVGGAFSALLTRIVLESVAVLFRIADNTSEIARHR